ncbi:MAG: hypothetical protein A4E64_01597 [Syntrophorhabdus sp. PtaU1.Bin058]|nr:MAG: hypothetical protein A4E64_01597 [Syntrophorhabdus sp. PtaU1.Bin058]
MIKETPKASSTNLIDNILLLVVVVLVVVVHQFAPTGLG